MKGRNIIQKSWPAILLIVLASCSPVKVSYLGNDYGSTKEAELFFSKADLPRDYRVIGEMIVRAPEGVNSEKVQRKLKREATSKGANAVLVEEFEVFEEGVALTGHQGYRHHHKDSSARSFNGTLVRVELIRFGKHLSSNRGK